MQIKLSYKLFAAFFLILAIVSGAMMLSRYLFSANFRDYMYQVELEKLQRLVPLLQSAYRAQGGWQAVAADPQRWSRLMHFAPEMGAPLPLPVPGGADSHGPAGAMAPHAPPPKDMPPGGPPDLLLMDAQEQPIIGRPGPDDQRRLVAVEVEGRIVGWLGLHRYEPLDSGPPAALMKRQASQLYLIGGTVIGLTALIALLFSRHLLKPVQRLARGTRELAERNFAVRIAPSTSDELGQLALNFNAMAHTLESYEMMRRQWLTDISHELRTPLSVLRGEIEALQDGVREATPANLASLHAEILRISKLVEDLHLLSLADSDRLSLEKQRISPASVLAVIVESYQARFARCRVKIDQQLSGIQQVRIWGDAHRLGQVFTNILENVCKYVQPPGALRISGRTDTQFLTLSFQDSGPGVPEEALPRLFDRLYRVEASRSRDWGGSGLGLAICRHIIENHDGRIWAEKSPAGGLTIVIKLPLDRKQKPSARPANG
jgi:two-component system sensor histidine kinase BaeS